MARFAYADPPYIGQSKKHYGKHADFAGEVDHAELIERLRGYDGWALSLSVKSLPAVLRLCPPDVLTLAWFKPIAPPLGDHRRYNWEPVILSPVRRYGPGYVPLAIVASPPQFTFREKPATHVIGEKPEAFCHWVFAAAGLTRADELDDLFPGAGAVARAWDSYVAGRTIMSALSRIRCMDCNRDTGARGLKEYPLMLRDEVWLGITAETGGAGVLCRMDIEQRLGRPLTQADMREQA